MAKDDKCTTNGNGKMAVHSIFMTMAKDDKCTVNGNDKMAIHGIFMTNGERSQMYDK